MGIASFKFPFMSPQTLKQCFPLCDKDGVIKAREEISKILFGEDKRFLLIVGPCSIHEETSLFDYATRLVKLKEKYSSALYIVMRCYLEKSRTSLGWQGLLSSPNINENQRLDLGLKKGREILVKVANMGLPVAYEVIDPLVVPYFSDVISWASIGARSSMSQIYRYLASSFSFPVGFKNTLEGDLTSPCNGILVAKNEHSFLTIDDDGKAVIACTNGNDKCHLVLRGYKKGDASISNYDKISLKKTQAVLEERGLTPAILIDSSHDNAHKIPFMQEKAFLEIMKMKYEGEDKSISDMIKGAMIESFINEGSISPSEYVKTKEYGVSITDPCISLEKTESLLDLVYKRYFDKKKLEKNDGLINKNEKVILKSKDWDVKKTKKINIKKLEIYTDGACSGNPGKGGWAFVIVEKNNVICEKSGFDEASTNNRMEMQAVIEALKEIHRRGFNDLDLTIYTDSSYVKNGITEWIKKWKANGWRSSSNSPVKNQDLWLSLDYLSSSLVLSWKWVKGHAGNKFNEMCDNMATYRAQSGENAQKHLSF